MAASVLALSGTRLSRVWPGLLAATSFLIAATALLVTAGSWPFALAFGAGTCVAAALILARESARAPAQRRVPETILDIPLLRAALDGSGVAMAVTDQGGQLLTANELYGELMGGYPSPENLPADHSGREDAAEAAARARREGEVAFRACDGKGRALIGHARRTGQGGVFLLWTFTQSGTTDLALEAEQMLGGEAGARLGEAGVMAALVDDQGLVVAANRAFAARATGRADGDATGAPLIDLILASEVGQFSYAIEGQGGAPLRIVQVPVGEGGGQFTLFAILDDHGGGLARLMRDDRGNVNALLDMLPLGLALVNVDGRFVYLNKAFRKAAGLAPDARPVYPGDLVVDEDKGSVSDLVRRFARGPSMSSDMAVTLKSNPDEPVALTVAGARGLGEATVLLSLKDNSEEDRLKRQVAQATKMQAVGQLAGGVAHDFNNILTAILGHCDLMLMRHTPGDSDYDDIQQIRSNSNRAAGLTRQLLAFSRQQTLRPQVLQLPDVIAEVSNLLKRLLGETVTLQTKHGRNLGAVRADPGQLEQVIVNLAVNARDAMPQGGTLTIQTFGVSAVDVRKMGHDVLPIGDYTALRVTDTGTGISPANMVKIFEPFFTTKEVGKGTGLGLSTVYGIVKQSGGYIFADSELGAGTSITIYLPVNKSEPVRPAKVKAKEQTPELWGTGTILLVEDEAMVRAVAERALTRHGYTVLTAENGEAALEILARGEQVDLMISDVVMPTMDGPTTVREARKTRPDLPILFISGYAEEQLRKSIDLEKVAFLAKPFSVQKLAEAARDALVKK
ncbi:response regulator [Allosphingosinicella vermicomposti]|uniref:response regulator n=1 Tax=Allosphingosinicella vermicomposti TaxID=614671 RepID=UPI001FE0119A|nr:response regulator [Allosphingosinicella vermicomposti]